MSLNAAAVSDISKKINELLNTAPVFNPYIKIYLLSVRNTNKHQVHIILQNSDSCIFLDAHMNTHAWSDTGDPSTSL